MVFSRLVFNLRFEVFCKPCKYRRRPQPRHGMETIWKPF
jgi:hypothetical protein